LILLVTLYNMRVDVCLYALLGIANASALIPRDPQDYANVEPAGYPEEEPDYQPQEYKEPEYKDAGYKEPEYTDPGYKEPEYTDSGYKQPEPTYAPKGDYPDKPDNYKEPDYAPKADYSEKPDYAPKGDYPEKSDYAPKGDYPEKQDSYKAAEYGHGYKPKESWKPKTHHPEFFSLKVDQDVRCTSLDPLIRAQADTCDIAGFAIRLEKGVVIATEYNKWWDPKLPIFFVDDDTQTYTVCSTDARAEASAQLTSVLGQQEAPPAVR
jgi:hypothetical protein